LSPGVAARKPQSAITGGEGALPAQGKTTMPITISSIYRYPVKGLSPERLARTTLSPRRCLPEDRRFAVALGSTRFDPAQPQWLPKRCFAMLMRDEKLARLDTRFDPATGELTIAEKGEVRLRARITEPAGGRAVGDFLGDFLGDSVEQPLRVLEAPGHAFADSRRKPDATTDQYISLINLRSIAALEEAMNARIDPLRFRANIYFDGAPAWDELGWIGSTVALGAARLRVIAAITRCAATEVNPETAERDLDITAALQRGFGHNLMGIYAEVAGGGDVAVDDELQPGRE
jgi:uncharacterized protein YcbX